MSIRFCQKCGSMMVPEKIDGKVIWKCRKCGHEEEGNNNEKLVIRQEINEKREIPIVDVEKQKEKLSVIDVECPKCHKMGAIWWLQQTRAADEPTTRFFKCVNCGYTWREYA